MKNRIRELRKANGLTMKELGEIIGAAESTISQYETGKRQLGNETLLRLGEYFGVSVGYILGAEGLPISTNLKTDASPLPAVRIPVLGSVPAGIPLEAIEDILDWEEIPATLCSGGREYFALQVKGDSMWPDYLPGDVVIVRRSPVCDSGDVCVVYVNGYDATLKQVKLLDNGSLTIIPKNQAYPPRTFTPEEIQSLPVSIAGIVVELRRKVSQ